MLGAGPAGAQGRIAEVCVPGICGQAPVLAREPAVDGCPADLCRFPAPLAVESLVAAARRSEVFSCSRRTRARPVTARSARSRARGLRAERLVHGADRGIDNPVAARAMVPRRSRQRGRAVSITVSPVLSAVDSQASPCCRAGEESLRRRSCRFLREVRLFPPFGASVALPWARAARESLQRKGRRRSDDEARGRALLAVRSPDAPRPRRDRSDPVPRQVREIVCGP